jgi:hypothetical protein
VYRRKCSALTRCASKITQEKGAQYTSELTLTWCDVLEIFSRHVILSRYWLDAYICQVRLHCSAARSRQNDSGRSHVHCRSFSNLGRHPAWQPTDCKQGVNHALVALRTTMRQGQCFGLSSKARCSRMPLPYQWIRSSAHYISSQYGGKDWYELAERQGGQCNSRQRSQCDGRLCFNEDNLGPSNFEC